MIFYLFITNQLLIINLLLTINNFIYYLIHIIFITLKYLISFQIQIYLCILISNYILTQYYLFKSFIIHSIINLILILLNL